MAAVGLMADWKTIGQWAAGAACWVKPVTSLHSTVYWWPMGEITREGRDGIIVIERPGAIRVVPPDTPCEVAGQSWIGLDGEELAAVMRLHRIASAICANEPLTISYQKRDSAGPEKRRIGRIVPSTDGAGIVCSDLDRMEPRRFNLHRITAVEDL